MGDRRVAARGVAVALAAIGGLSTTVAGVAVASTSHSGSSVVVSTIKSSKYGTVLASGKTLYTLKASSTACTSACLKAWPELTLPKGVTKATAGSGVSAAKLGTVSRSGGVLQVTYDGKPLYYFIGDTAAGQVHGNLTDTWGTWSVVVIAKATSSGSSSGASSGSSSSSGSGTSSGGNTGTGGVAF
jgi:predicted lipoprotein with Yx(FWY)xxD motif